MAFLRHRCYYAEVPPASATSGGRGEPPNGPEAHVHSVPQVPSTAPKKWSIPTQYAGVRMRSRLEATTARWFDQHRIVWVYEPEGFHFGNVSYLPDFYLPELRTIVEVKGILDSRDHQKLRALVVPAAAAGVMTVLWEAGPIFRLCNPSPQMWQQIQSTDELPDFLVSWPFNPECDLSTDIAIVRCANCRHWYFLDSSLGWQCQACGHYDDDMTFDLVHPNSPGWTTWDCPDCGATGSP